MQRGLTQASRAGVVHRGRRLVALFESNRRAVVETHEHLPERKRCVLARSVGDDEPEVALHGELIRQIALVQDAGSFDRLAADGLEGQVRQLDLEWRAAWQRE